MLDRSKSLKEIGPVAYRLNLTAELGAVHNVFHVSNLKKCLSDETLIVPLKELTIDEQLHFVEEPVEITDRDVKVLKNTRIPLVRVRWNSRRGLCLGTRRPNGTQISSVIPEQCNYY